MTTRSLKSLTFLFTLLILQLCAFSQTPFNGSYFVGGSGAQFTSVVDAVDSLKKVGVSGPVVFQIRPGTYTGKVVLTAITGASATNTITFRPDSALGGTVVLTSIDSVNIYHAVVTIEGAQHIRLDSLTLQVHPSNASGSVLIFKDNSAHLEIQDCRLVGLVVSCAATTHSTYKSTVYASSTQAATVDMESISFTNNRIENGSYGVYLNGFGGNKDIKSWEFKENRVYGYCATGIHLSKIQDVEVVKNEIKSAIPGHYFCEGIAGVSSKNIQLDQNQIEINSLSEGYGISFTGLASTGGVRNRISNNFIYVNPADAGIKLHHSEHTDLLYNSVKMDGLADPGSFAAEITSGKSVVLKNNVFANFTGGRALFVTGSTHTWDYNNLFTTGTTLSNVTPGTHSVMANPQFYGVKDLHVLQPKLNGNAQVQSGLTVDFDGDTRNSVNPDIGADEFDPVGFDLAVEDIVGNSTPLCAGTRQFKVRVVNLGSDTVRSFAIHWNVHSGSGTVAMPDSSWTGKLPVGEDTTVVFGELSLLANVEYTLNLWIDSINGTRDSLAANDSLFGFPLRTGLSGVYDVGANGDDFSSLSEANSALQAYGMCGPVSLHLRAGIYPTNLTLTKVPGLSATDSLLITKDSSAAFEPILKSIGSQVLTLHDIEHVTIRQLVLTYSPSLGSVLRFTGDNRKICIDQCTFKGDTLVHTDAKTLLSKDSEGSLDYLTVSNSKFEAGNYFVQLKGISYNRPDSFNVFTNCTFENFIEDGFVAQDQYGMVVDGCTMISDSVSKVDRAIGYELNRCNFLKFTNNLIQFQSAASNLHELLVLYYSKGSASNPSLIANNRLALFGSSSSSGGKGIYLYKSDHLNVQHNSIFMGQSSNAATACFTRLGNFIKYQNNNFVMAGKGHAFFLSGTLNTTEDFNNFYAPKGNPSNVRQGYNGIQVDPGFSSTHNLRTRSSTLNGKGKPLASVTLDFEGQTRSVTQPDIGADEFNAPSLDIQPSKIGSPFNLHCGQDSSLVEVELTNNGTQNSGAVNIELRLSGMLQDTLYSVHNTAIPAGGSVWVNLGKIPTRNGGELHLELIAKMTGDLWASNDTLTLNNSIDPTPSLSFSGSVTKCAAIDTSLLATTRGDTILWFDNLSQDPIHMGSSFNLHSKQTDTIWAQAANWIEGTAGSQDNHNWYTQYSPWGRFDNPDLKGLTFDLKQPILLESVWVFTFGGFVTVVIQDSSGKALDTSYVNKSSSPHAHWIEVPIQTHLPSGVGYRMISPKGLSSILWKDSLQVHYPYTEPTGSVVVTGDQNGDTTEYPFFYRWEFSTYHCGSEAEMIPIQVRPGPVVDLGNDSTYCAGTLNRQLQASHPDAQSYSWQDGSSLSTFQVQQKGTYHVEITDASSCYFRDTIVFDEWALPKVSIDDALYCANDLVDSLVYSPDSGSLSGPGISQGLFDPALAGPGLHSVIYTYVDSNTCQNQDTAMVHVDTVPVVSFSYASHACQDSIQALALSGGQPGPGGVYSGPGVNQSLYFPAQIGKDTLVYTYTDANGCSDSAQSIVDVVAYPVVTFDSISPVCENAGLVPLLVQPSGGTFMGNGISGTHFDPAFTGVGQYTLSYSVSNIHQCTTIKVRQVEVLPKPQVSYLGPDTACLGDGKYSLWGGFPSGGYYFGNHVDSSANTFDVQTSGTGTFTVNYSYVDFNGCSDSASQTLQVNSSPLVDLGPDSTLCWGNQVRLDAGNPGATYQWNTGQQGATILVTSSGYYQVTVEQNGCATTSGLQLTFDETCVGVDESEGQLPDVRLFPNPTTGTIQLEFSNVGSKDVSLILLQADGKMIFEEQFSPESTTWSVRYDLSDHADGIYLMRIQTEREVGTFRFQIRH